MTGAMDNPFQAKNINLNTIVALAGFLGVFSTLIVAWSNVQYKQAASESWQLEHLAKHEKLAADGAAYRAAFQTQLNAMQAQLNELEQVKYRLALNEKGIENQDARTNRITESYGNQFTEIHNQLSTMNIQIALSNDILKRLEGQEDRRTGTVPQKEQ